MAERRQHAAERVGVHASAYRELRPSRAVADGGLRHSLLHHELQSTDASDLYQGYWRGHDDEMAYRSDQDQRGHRDVPDHHLHGDTRDHGRYSGSDPDHRDADRRG